MSEDKKTGSCLCGEVVIALMNHQSYQPTIVIVRTVKNQQARERLQLL